MKNLLPTGLLLLISCEALAEVSPRLIALSCRNCHSGSGMAIPSLNRLSAAQIEQALLDFQSDRRQSTVMGRLAKGFSEQEIRAIAEQMTTRKH